MTSDEFANRIIDLVSSRRYVEALELSQTSDAELDGELTLEQRFKLGDLLTMAYNIVQIDRAEEARSASA